MYKLFGQIPGDLCMISFWCGTTLGLNLDILQQRIGFQVGMDNTSDLNKSTYIPANISHRGPCGHGTYICLFPDRVFSHWTPSRFPRRKENPINPITGHLWPSSVYHWLVVTTDNPPSQSSLSKVNSHNLKVAEFGNMAHVCPCDLANVVTIGSPGFAPANTLSNGWSLGRCTCVLLWV